MKHPVYPPKERSEPFDYPWLTGPGLVVGVIALTVITGAMLGLIGAVAWTVFHALTGGFR